MLKKLIIAENLMDTSTWQTYETFNVPDKLQELYSNFPSNARIYHQQISVKTDVTPLNSLEIEHLLNLEGTFYVIHYPEGAIAVVAIVIAIVVVAAAFFIKPKIPSVVQRNQIQSSPNNQLSERTNTARPGERIPYIVGTVTSIPDLITVPYKTFDKNREVEHCVLCVGEGFYDIQKVLDDQTNFGDVDGNSIQIYNPNTSIYSGTPFFKIGTSFNDPVYNVAKSSSITGQTLNPPNARTFTGPSTDNKGISFKPGGILVNHLQFPTWTQVFSTGDEVTLTNANFTYNGQTLNVNGIYIIQELQSNSVMILSNPSLVNSNWNYITSETARGTTTITVNETLEVGPYTLNMTTRNKIIANFVALNGLYKDDGNQQRVTVKVRMTVTSIATNQTNIFEIELIGSSASRDSIGVTMDVETSFIGPCTVQFKRLTDTDRQFNGTVVDEVKVRDVYAVETLSSTDSNFGPFTIARVKTYATLSSLSIKDRKLRILLTRKFPKRNANNTFTTELYPTNSADDILCAVCLEPTIGNRNINELDITNIYNTIQNNKNYFGIIEASQFCYTFDNNNISFEETVAAIADAIFCKAYRRGNLIKLSFEKATEDSVLLFNHRNKLPDTESRSVSFGYLNDNDGLELDYVSPIDDAVLTYYIPSDQSAINPKKIETIGIRSDKQAYILAWRVWAKMKYQNTLSQFNGTDEASILLLSDRILLTDNTRPVKMEGEIIAINGLELTCSQRTVLEAGKTYSIFLQLTDATIQSIPITQGSSQNKIILQLPPRLPLIADSSYYARSTYQIVASNDKQKNAFLITEIDPQDNYSSMIKCINYDSRYYERDKDFI